MATYILISGAWHAGWCWERVVPLLEAAGHRVLAPDLVGMGPGDDTPLATVTLDLWAEQVAALVSAQAEPVVLVGHSRGGIVISAVADRVPDRIATLVYLAAFLVRPGETLLGTASRVPRDEAAALLVMHEDGSSTVDPAAVGPVFYNGTEPDWVARASAMLGAEPMAVFATPLDLGERGFGSVRRAYVECIRDNAVPLALQRLMQADLPCAPVFTLETDHSPFYSAPEALAACLIELA